MRKISKDEEVEILTRMRDYTFPYVTPISFAEKHRAIEVGNHWGTGNFIYAGKNVALITNAHVARRATNYLLGYVVRSGDRVANRNRDFVCTRKESPLDVAFTRVEPCVFEQGEKSAVPLGKLETSAGLSEEILFIHGYPATTPDGSPLAMSLGILGLRNQGLTMLARSADSFGDTVTFDVTVFSEVAGQEVVDMGSPHGLSGSFVWRTKFSELGRWNPGDATICGLVQRWDPDRKTFICTKVEEVNSFVDYVVAQESQT